MGHLYHGYVSQNQRVYPIKTTILLVKPHSTTIKPQFSYGFPMVLLTPQETPGRIAKSPQYCSDRKIPSVESRSREILKELPDLSANP